MMARFTNDCPRRIRKPGRIHTRLCDDRTPRANHCILPSLDRLNWQSTNRASGGQAVGGFVLALRPSPRWMPPIEAGILSVPRSHRSIDPMHILAIETVDRSGSIAILDDRHVLAKLDLDPTMRSAQSLAPGIAAVLGVAQIKPSGVEMVAVATGPG